MGRKDRIQKFLHCLERKYKAYLPTWIFLLLTGSILAFDIPFLVKVESKGICGIVGMVIDGLLWSMIFCYLFPAVTGSEMAGEMNLKGMLTRSLYLAVRNLPYAAEGDPERHSGNLHDTGRILRGYDHVDLYHRWFRCDRVCEYFASGQMQGSTIRRI